MWALYTFPIILIAGAFFVGYSIVFVNADRGSCCVSDACSFVTEEQCQGTWAREQSCADTVCVAPPPTPAPTFNPCTPLNGEISFDDDDIVCDGDTQLFSWRIIIGDFRAPSCGDSTANFTVEALCDGTPCQDVEGALNGTVVMETSGGTLSCQTIDGVIYCVNATTFVFNNANAGRAVFPFAIDAPITSVVFRANVTFAGADSPSTWLSDPYNYVSCEFDCREELVSYDFTPLVASCEPPVDVISQNFSIVDLRDPECNPIETRVFMTAVCGGNLCSSLQVMIPGEFTPFKAGIFISPLPNSGEYLIGDVVISGSETVAFLSYQYQDDWGGSPVTAWQYSNFAGIGPQATPTLDYVACPP
jgi:hypothetical protein